MDVFVILWCFKVFPTGYEWHCSGRRINCMGSGKNICIYIIQITYPSEHFQQRKWNYFFLLVHEHWWILCGYVVFSLKKRLWCIMFQKQIVETVGHCICKNYNYKGGWSPTTFVIGDKEMSVPIGQQDNIWWVLGFLSSIGRQRLGLPIRAYEMQWLKTLFRNI